MIEYLKSKFYSTNLMKSIFTMNITQLIKKQRPKFLAFQTMLFFSLFILSCKKEDTLFTSLTQSDTNIDFNNTLFEDGPLNVANYIYFYNGGGVAIGDINNDGLQDVLFTGNMVKNRLFINKGNMEFEDITAKSGIADKQGWCTGASMADVNADGKLDIYICRSADINPEMRKNLLFINNGDLSFTEKGDEFGLADVGYSTQAGFLDYDKDGDLDCFINNHSLSKYTAGEQDNISHRNDRDPNVASKLYRNDNGHYTDVSLEAGIKTNVLTFGLGMAISDMNNDGWPDIYVSNDFNEQDYYFVNNKNGTFTEQLTSTFDQVSLYSMGNDAADYNNDGLVDLVTLDMQPEDNKTMKQHSGAENFDKFQQLFKKGYFYQYSRNMLQKNNGDGTFSEVAQMANVSNTDWSWASLFSDFDNDGFKDLFVTNGYVKDYSDMDFLKYSVGRVIRKEKNDEAGIKDYLSKMPSNKIPNYILQNNNGVFTKKTMEWGFEKPLFSYGTAYADLDNDGDMDLVVNNSNDLASVYKNNTSETLKNSYLKIKLTGDQKNNAGFGSKITLYSGENQFFQEQQPVRGFQSSVDPVLNFGLGKSATIDSLIIVWPNDKKQKLVNIKVNQTINLKQIDATETLNFQNPALVNTIFKENNLLNFTHKENEFSDFTVQSLLPHYLSKQGPCMAKADINGDKKEDLFIGGARGQAGAVFLQTASGGFIEKTNTVFIKDINSEDVAAEFFDADKDGDNDLYVGSGGYEYAENDPLLKDRLYLNDGKGNFTKAENALPQMTISTGAVKATDIDKDGDQDLFVGGRLVPSLYPSSPESKILLNDGKGKFTDATLTNAPGIQKIGMVTDATWLDLNNDNYQDLVIAGEWMPIKVFINTKGKLKEESEKYIKFASSGWWNKIIAEDFDGDGDKDLVIGNLGTNAQFKASEAEPISIYYKDFDNRGSFNPIFCYYIDGVSYPACSRDDLVDQMPILKKKFLEYKTYSVATINDIFSAEQLENVGLLKAEMLTSVYLQNNGKQGFALKTLPQEVQSSPVKAMTVVDYNNDGKKDLVMAGNNVWNRIKFGRYTANHGLLLEGDGKGNFKYIAQAKSGLNLKGDVKSMQLVGKKLVAGVNNNPVKMYSF
jgi:enediyne biosynthesis protein E4